MMDFNGRRIRAKLVALLVVLVALWSYAAYLTSRDALDLGQVRALGGSLGQPTDLLILGLQAERRLTVNALGTPTAARTPLHAQRARTDEAIARLRAFTDDTDPRLVLAGAVRDRARALVGRLDGVGGLRRDVDAGRLDPDGAARAYDGLVDAGFAVYGAQWSSRESALIDETRSMVALARAREILAREDTLVSAALVNRRVSAGQQRQLGELVANQRFARTEAASGLPAAARASYQRLVAGPEFANLSKMEDRLLRADAAEATTVTAQAWQAAVGPALAGLRDLVGNGIRDSVERATPGAAGVIVRTGLVVGLGLVAVVAAIVGSIGTARRLAFRLARLRTSSAEFTERELPELVKRLRRGEPVDAPPEPLPLPAGADRFDQLDRVVEAARVASVRALLTETESHRGTWDLFLQLTRRNQALLRDQLGVLDAMERRERDGEELADLFRIDHLATQTRRNVEKLITLAGATPARRWRRPVPLLDVVRGAVAEVADYPRVLMAPDWPGSLAGPLVPDLIHLLAELIDNGLAYSPKNTTVRVGGEPAQRGFAVVVTDDGRGMSEPALAAANELLRDPPLHRAPGTGHGLYAVGSIARRRGVTVTLRPTPRGGTTAIVLIPTERLVAAPSTATTPKSTATNARSNAATDNDSTRTVEFPYLAVRPEVAPTRAEPPLPRRDTPSGLPVRPRQSGPVTTPPTPLTGPPSAAPTASPSAPVTAPQPAELGARRDDDPVPRTHPDEADVSPVPARTGPPESDGFETIEMPVARPVGDPPPSDRSTPRATSIGLSPSTQPTRVGGGFDGSERTTSGSVDGHDR